ncbi:MAG TPA: hypothetical protein DEB10_13260 [Ruminococcaceae bacterium]|jgi:aromatic ring-opening dioxygenase LigB subunit|nr:hypothetical protein [Oscillospiraceae bacterium]
MSNEQKGQSLIRCIELCKKQLEGIANLQKNFIADPNPDGYEEIDALLRTVDKIERHCQNIRSYVKNCDEY